MRRLDYPKPSPAREGVMRVTASTSMTDEVLEREADSLPYGVPLPKPEFAKGSDEEIPR
jgi:hypothetical protein